MTLNHDAHTMQPLYSLASVALLAAGLGLGIWYALPVLLPFLLARVTAAVLRPVVDFTAGKKRGLRKLVAAGLVLLSVGLILLFGIKCVERGMRELSRLAEGLSREDSEISLFWARLSEGVMSLSSHLPFLERFSEHPQFDAFCVSLDEAVRSAVESVWTTLSRRIPSAALTLAGQLPAVLLFLTTWLLACYDFCAAPLSPEERLIACLPVSWRTKCEFWRKTLAKAVGGYLRAYIMLGALTFGEMLLALSILRLPYALLMAAVIALLDFLPVLGAGTVLLPWAVGCFLGGMGSRGTALLIIWGVHTLLRQISEPRLVGRELGLSPILSLAAVYAGWKLFGITGMLLSPLAVMVAREMLKDGQKTPSEG